MLRCGGAADRIDFRELDFRELDFRELDFRESGADWLLERAMRANAFEKLALVAAVVAAGAMFGAAGGRAQGFAAAKPLPAMAARPALILVQNAFTPFSLPETGEPPVSPINPGSLPGSTAAIGGSATGTNPVTGLPCNGSGSISVSGAGGLPGTATPPPSESTETLGQIPVGVPPTSSIYSSQANLGAC